MTARDAESDLSPFRAIAVFSAPSGQFHARRCKAAKLVAQAKMFASGPTSRRPSLRPSPLGARFVALAFLRVRVLWLAPSPQLTTY